MERSVNEDIRLKDLLSYRILDTPPEQELDEITQVASVVCGIEVALLSFIDDERQWFKSTHGYEIEMMPRKMSFCQHTLGRPDEVLVVEDALLDSRFSGSPLVNGGPGVRFYAGAPLVSPEGNVLGTLCVLDNKPGKLSESQQKAMQHLARQVMRFLEARKLIMMQRESIAGNIQKLIKLSDQAPGVLFQMELGKSGEMSFPFISRGISKLHPGLDPRAIMQNPRLAFSVIHPDDQPLIRQTILEAISGFNEWYVEYRVMKPDGSVEWHMGKAYTERGDDGKVICYGTFQNISHFKEYQETLEKIAFDISHVLRKPVANLMALNAMLDGVEDPGRDELMEYLGYVKIVSEELENFTVELNRVYSEKRKGLGDGDPL